MFPVILCAIFAISTASAGSPCPPREAIYPCSCVNTPLSKRTMFTAITCHRLGDSDSLRTIFNALRSIQIDQFHLYDSFWEAHKLGETQKTVFPADWLSLLKIVEIEIVDTALSDDFLCQWSMDCKNGVTTRFSAVNSSMPMKKWLCATIRNNSFPWTGCMSKLNHFHFTHGKLNTLGIDIFPVNMMELTVLNLTYNQLSKINKRAFKNLPKLAKLDLSHNLLEHLDDMFDSKQMMALEYLDVSWNSIKSLGSSLLSVLPSLKTFIIHNNLMVYLEKDIWESIPDSMRIIDLSGNPIHCGCNVQWIKSKITRKISLIGSCATPGEYRNSFLKIASLAVNRRCDGNDFRTKSISPTTPWNSGAVPA